MLPDEISSSKFPHQNRRNGSFILAICLIFLGAVDVLPQLEKFNPGNPARQCFTFDGTSSAGKIIASDNKSNSVFFSGADNKVRAFDVQGKIPSWVFEIPGQFENISAKNGDSLFLVSKSTSPSNEVIDQINAVSLKSGITSWRINVPGVKSLYLPDETGLLYILTNRNEISAVNPANGSVTWSRDLERKAEFLGTSRSKNLFVGNGVEICEIGRDNGQIISRVRFDNENPDNGAVSALADSLYLIAGDAKGVVRKYSLSSANTTWNFKTGGGISFVENTAFGVLVTSLDNFIYLFDPKNGNIRWKKRISDRVNIKPLIFGKLAFIASYGSQNVFAVDLEAGQIVNRISVGEENYIIEKPFLINDRLLLQTTKGLMIYSFSDCK